MIKNISELRHPIEIVRTVSARVNGEMTEHDETVCNCYAAIKDAGNHEYFAAAATQLEDVVNFTIRWNNAVKVGMEVIYGGTRHKIVQVSHLSYRQDFMVLKTGRKAVASG